MPVTLRRIALGISCACLLTIAANARAQQSTWTFLVSGNWSVPGNWDTLPASGTTTSLVFNNTGATGYTATNDLGNPFVLNLMSFVNTGTGTITIAPAAAGGVISFAGNSPALTQNGSGAVAISNPINLGANTAFGGTGTGTVTLSGGLQDAGAGFGLNVGSPAVYAFSAGTSNISFLHVGFGTTNINGGAWTVNSATDNATASLVVGATAGQSGAFNLSGGSTFTSSAGNLIFGDPATSTGTGTITGASSTLTATNATQGRIVVGNNGTGNLTVDNGAVVNARLPAIGRNAGSNGTVTIGGATTQWNSAGTFAIGVAGTGTVTVQNGATVTTTGSAATRIGDTGTGTLTVQSGGHWTSAGSVLVGINANGMGNLNISGASSLLAIGGTSGLQAGNNANSTGNVSILNGSQLTIAASSYFGLNTNSTGNLTVSGSWFDL
jgi:T5SS/PEP-CTERM-associated repeat protein